MSVMWPAASRAPLPNAVAAPFCPQTSRAPSTRPSSSQARVAHVRGARVARGRRGVLDVRTRPGAQSPPPRQSTGSRHGSDRSADAERAATYTAAPPARTSQGTARECQPSSARGTRRRNWRPPLRSRDARVAAPEPRRRFHRPRQRDYRRSDDRARRHGRARCRRSCSSKPRSGRGSAFFVQHDTLITNVHVVQQDGYVTLRKMDGSSVNARVHTRAPAFDIAVLKVAQASASQAVLPMGTAQSLKPGQEVVVIGSALGTLQNSVSRGIVSGVRNSGGVTLVQSDAAANPGNSGGPMLDRNGRVVGHPHRRLQGPAGPQFRGVDRSRARHSRGPADQSRIEPGRARQHRSRWCPAAAASGEPTAGSSRASRNFPERVGLRRTAAANQLDGAWTAVSQRLLQIADPRLVRSRVVCGIRARRDPGRCGSGLHRLSTSR